MAAEAQRGDGDFDDDDPDYDESLVMAVLSTIDRIHDLPELLARAASFDSDRKVSLPKSRWDFGCIASVAFSKDLRADQGTDVT
ncbi:hypothetical protein D8674_038573 [Pyrus ussuriensis x Pyrus communis]|uniref:Uncharacterized protein n=1 Tax=Pyrus ussuriensis x Pyrus communis TaxID=2448454 RepID=A0A5N5GKC5_9ROSA|nr:hypothetical protein D8674_038546 [Pyrus ussuriensis x Pyrus communis]KAB2634167.1 hypothetical protein D8674_038573 [Pyrus ussuriensis x Pyrus communis]